MNNKKLSNMLFLIIFAIFAVPLSSMIPMGKILWYNQWLMLLLLSCIGMSMFLWKRNKILSILTAYCSYSAIVIAHQNPSSLMMLVQLYLSCLAIDVISRLSRREVKIILWAVIVMAAVQGVFVVFQFFGIDPIFNAVKSEKFYSTVGFCGSRNQLGLFFSIVSPLFYAFAPILIPLAVFCLWCASTASAWVGFLVGCLCMTFCVSKKRFALTLVTLVICSVIFFVKFENVSAGAYKERIELYKHTIESVESERVVLKVKKKIQGKDITAVKEIFCNKWFGYGFGNFTRISPYTQHTFLKDTGIHAQKHVYTHAHNDFLEFFYDTGRIGILIVLMLMFQFFKDFIYARKTKILIVSFSCVLAQLVSAMGIFTVHTAISGMLLIIFYGIYRREINEQKRTFKRASFMV